MLFKCASNLGEDDKRLLERRLTLEVHPTPSTPGLRGRPVGHQGHPDPSDYTRDSKGTRNTSGGNNVLKPVCFNFRNSFEKASFLLDNFLTSVYNSPLYFPKSDESRWLTAQGEREFRGGGVIQINRSFAGQFRTKPL